MDDSARHHSQIDWLKKAAEFKLAVELAVRAEADRFGYSTQEYPRWVERFWWETYGDDAREVFKRWAQRTREGDKPIVNHAPRGGIPCLHWYFFSTAAGLTGQLYGFPDADFWAFGIERWWRYADGRRLHRGIFGGMDSDLRTCIRRGTDALNLEAGRVAKWLNPSAMRVQVIDSVYRLGGEPPPAVTLKLDGQTFHSPSEALASIGVHDHEEWVHPRLHEERVRICTDCGLERPEYKRDAEYIMTAPGGLQWFACAEHQRKPIQMRIDDLDTDMKAAHRLGGRVFISQELEDFWFDLRASHWRQRNP